MMHIREVIFEPMQQPKGFEPLPLHVHKDLMDPDGGWVLFSYLAPESVCAHSEAVVHPWVTVHVRGDALCFTCALGYVRQLQIYKRGYVFRWEMLVIHMFQQEKIDQKTQEPIPALADTLWEVKHMPVSHAIDAVLDVQLLMKGS
ncbi:hypothetical protein IW261DRAFT_1553815 [Armillaria novae-zelandiae]|uniref:Uncharacterized protein n=1 Tax=Armillaria novae-zelandiae TaxID=153914 RepID=A0AA39NN51_9AGAR|nr:hypothetical protein IW261DRAFT_1553815 [Armillaria novae-zelandiae]